MRICVISAQNGLLAGAIVKYLKERGNIQPERVVRKSAREPLDTCVALNAEIVLMEVTRYSPFTLEERLLTIRLLHEQVPDLKITLLCDETADPKLAQEVVSLMKNKEIDMFFYTSVSGEYLCDVLEAL